MKGDFTRLTFDPKKRYSGVRMQQGRVQLDADWNEQIDIQDYLQRTALNDAIGARGVPRELPDSFQFYTDQNGDFQVKKGRLWVDGVLCEAEADLGVDTAALDDPDATYLVYLDVWQRHVTAVEDPSILESALGGPDTTTRTQTVFQPRLAKVNTGDTCLQVAGWQDPGATDGTLDAQFNAAAQQSEDLCEVPSDTGYAGIENHLYRVEVHDGGTVGTDTVTVKWSRDNGSIVSPWLASATGEVTIPGLRQDSVRGFHDAPFFIELLNDLDDLAGRPGAMEQVTGHEEGAGGETVLLLAGDPAVDPPLDGQHPKVRRWDSAPLEITADTWIALEHGLEVKLSAGTYRSGDYWLIPARAFLGGFSGAIEWPGTPQPPYGVLRRTARLAVIDLSAGEVARTDDCRRIFSPLAEQISFHAAGGDGQSAIPGDVLPCPLKVAVLRGQTPVAGAQVRFTVVPNGGTLNGSVATTVTVETGADGVCSCSWTLPSVFPPGGCLNVTAELLGAGGTEVAAPITFTASIHDAQRVAYAPDADAFPYLSTESDVQGALDKLSLLSQASQVGFTPVADCPTLTNVGDVETAINELCIANGGGRRDIVSELFSGAADGTIKTLPVDFMPKFVFARTGVYRIIRSYYHGTVVTGYANLTGGVAEQACVGFKIRGGYSAEPYCRDHPDFDRSELCHTYFYDAYNATSSTMSLTIESFDATGIDIKLTRSYTGSSNAYMYIFVLLTVFG